MLFKLPLVKALRRQIVESTGASDDLMGLFHLQLVFLVVQ